MDRYIDIKLMGICPCFKELPNINLNFFKGVFNFKNPHFGGFPIIEIYIAM
jgi:hypothetical protein